MLEKIEDRLVFFSASEEKFNPIYVDFVEGKAFHRRVFSGKELIAKAVGFKKSASLTVIDATAGLGRDAFVLASLGCNVTLMERSEILAALLADGLRRAKENASTEMIADRMQLISGDAKELLLHQSADVIYLDPMYPHQDKSALVKKEMRILREILGDDDDAEALFNIALKTAKKRVVVKRPKHADFINHKKPDIMFEGSSTRFDVYVRS
jgi:16S rRNA (guanine1516-N2)-methyltransferase